MAAWCAATVSVPKPVISKATGEDARFEEDGTPMGTPRRSCSDHAHHEGTRPFEHPVGTKGSTRSTTASATMVTNQYVSPVATPARRRPAAETATARK